MNETLILVSLIAGFGWLVLNIRALRSHRLPFERRVAYAVVWIVIFAVAAFVAGRLLS